MESKPLVLYQNTAVTGIHVADGRVSSVETTAGAIEAEVVVGAAGPQTGLMAEMVGVHVPGAPARVRIHSRPTPAGLADMLRRKEAVDAAAGTYVENPLPGAGVGGMGQAVPGGGLETLTRIIV